MENYLIDRAGQTWTNGRELFLCVESYEAETDVWKHIFVDLDDGHTCTFEESEEVDWKGKELSYWKRVNA